MTGARWDSDIKFATDSELQAVIASLSGLGATLPYSVYVKKDEGTGFTAAYARGSSSPLLAASADAGVHIQAAADAIEATGRGGTIGFEHGHTYLMSTGIVLNGDGIHLHGAGHGNLGDARLPMYLQMNSSLSSPYSGGMGTTPMFSVKGDSCGIHGMIFDGNNRVRKAAAIGTDGTDGRSFDWEDSTIGDGTDYGVHWLGDDGVTKGGRIHLGVGGDGTHGIAAFWMEGSDNNIGNIHIHGSGLGANDGRTVIVKGQTNKFTGVHAESGIGSDSPWNVEIQGAKIEWTGGIIGHMELGGELLIHGNAHLTIAGTLFHPDYATAPSPPQNATPTNTYDMVKLDSPNSRLTMGTCTTFHAAGAPQFKRAFVADAGAIWQVNGSYFNSVTSIWNNAPTVHKGNLYNDAAVAGE